jgi:hypothetical protein
MRETLKLFLAHVRGELRREPLWRWPFLFANALSQLSKLIAFVLVVIGTFIIPLMFLYLIFWPR